MKIAIQGAAGRMGRMLDTLAAGFGLEVVSRVDVGVSAFLCEKRG